MDEAGVLNVTTLLVSQGRADGGLLLHSPEARIGPSLSSPPCPCDLRCRLSFSGPNLLTLKGKAKSQVHMGGDQSNLMLCPLTSLYSFAASAWAQ